MKHGVTFLILVLILTGCRNTAKVKISDLKFGDFEKEAIARNRVDTMYLISKDPSLNLWESDTFGKYVYDNTGNLINDWQERLGGHYIFYSYDSLGWVVNRDEYSDYHAGYQAKYKFLPDSFLLYQGWTEGIDTDSLLYTIRFQFEKSGRLLEVDGYGNRKRGSGGDKTIYVYNQAGDVILKRRVIILSSAYLERFKNMGEEPVTEETTAFFYSGRILDSIITTEYRNPNRKKSKVTKTFYRSDGLRDITLAIGANLYRHFINPKTGKRDRASIKGIMDTLTTHYAYSMRTN